MRSYVLFLYLRMFESWFFFVQEDIDFTNVKPYKKGSRKLLRA